MGKKEFDTFFQHEEGKKIIDFYDFLVQTWDEFDYYVFICRSSYWLFLILCAQNGWMIDKSRILSDRYVIKEYDLKLKDKRVALIDDTMMTGYALYRVFSKLRQWYPEMQIETMVVYCGTQKIEPQQISRNPKAERALIDEFVSSIQYVTEASYETLGAFSFHMARLVQHSMVPYVVELPFLVNSEYAVGEYLKDLRQDVSAERTVTIPGRAFLHLISSENNWHYRDNSYSLPNEEEIYCGYFYYSGAELQKAFGGYLLRSIVKCRYEWLENDQVKILFTPFAVFQCMDYEEARKITLRLYEGTAYENFLQKAQDRIQEGLGKLDEKFEVAIYRSIVYFVSEYIARLFSDYVSEFGILLGQNEDLLENHVSDVFANTVGEIMNWSRKRFLLRLFRVSQDYQDGEQRYFDRNCSYSYEERLELSYQELYNEVIRRKRQTHTVFSFTLEEMTEFLYREVGFPSIETLKDCLVGALLRMLDIGILGNVLEYDKGNIKRGFRYGENSDVILPYYNPYVFWALDLKYRQIEKEYEEDGENVKSNKILNFLNYFYFFLERKNYFDIIVDREDYRQIRDYLSVDWDCMKRIILNKRFLLKEMPLNNMVCKEIMEYVLNM